MAERHRLFSVLDRHRDALEKLEFQWKEVLVPQLLLFIQVLDGDNDDLTLHLLSSVQMYLGLARRTGLRSTVGTMLEMIRTCKEPRTRGAMIQATFIHLSYDLCHDRDLSKKVRREILRAAARYWPDATLQSQEEASAHMQSEVPGAVHAWAFLRDWLLL